MSTRPKPYELTDEFRLSLLVMPTGERFWRFKYRFEGKQRTRAFGNYPDLPLAKARAMRTAAREALAEGRDAAVHKEQEREVRARSQDTFQAISEETLEAGARWPLHGKHDEDAWLLDFAKSGIGDRSITELTTPELQDVLRKIKLRGRHASANRLRSTFGTIFR